MEPRRCGSARKDPKQEAEKGIKESLMVPGHPRGVCQGAVGGGASEQPVWSQRWMDLSDKPGRMREIPTGVTPAMSASVSGSEAKMERFTATAVWMDGWMGAGLLIRQAF